MICSTKFQEEERSRTTYFWRMKKMQVKCFKHKFLFVEFFYRICGDKESNFQPLK